MKDKIPEDISPHEGRERKQIKKKHHAGDVLIEENRYTPYGAISEKNPEKPVEGAPVNPKDP